MGYAERAELPREVQVEVTAACNLRCKMCLVAYRPPLNKIEGSMSFETFTRIIDEVPHLEGMTLQGLGEPLLAPRIFDMIRYASERGIAVGFNTNATMLTRERARKLIEHGLAWLHISLDGTTKDTYEHIRGGSDFERVARNIEGLLEVRAEAGATRPFVSLVFVAMRRNVAELPDLVAFAGRVGIEKVWVQNLSHSFSDTQTYGGIRDFVAAEALWPLETDHVRESFDRAQEKAAGLGVELRLPRIEPAPPLGRAEGEPGCDWPWRAAYITHDGVMQPCCMVMGEDRATLGDLRHGSFAEEWNNDGYRSFRRALLSDEPPEVCRGCSLYRGVF